MSINETPWEIEERERAEREYEEARRFHDQDPGRWGDHASPRRMRADVMREREEDRYR